MMPLWRQHDKVNGDGRVRKTQIPGSLNRTPFLGRMSYLFRLLCVEHIKDKIQLHSQFTLLHHGRETKPVGSDIDSKVKRAPLSGRHRSTFYMHFHNYIW